MMMMGLTPAKLQHVVLLQQNKSLKQEGQRCEVVN